MADGSEAGKDLPQHKRGQMKGKGKERVGQYSLEGLALAWDNTPTIRQRLRQDQHFLVHYDSKLKRTVYKCDVAKTIPNARANRWALQPLFGLMRHNSMLLPSIDRLVQQVQLLYSTSLVTCSGDTAYHEAWSLREMLTLLKAEGQRCTRPDKPRKVKDRVAQITKRRKLANCRCPLTFLIPRRLPVPG